MPHGFLSPVDVELTVSVGGAVDTASECKIILIQVRRSCQQSINEVIGADIKAWNGSGKQELLLVWGSIQCGSIEAWFGCTATGLDSLI